MNIFTELCINDQIEAREGRTEAAEDAQMHVRDLCLVTVCVCVCVCVCVYGCMYVCINDA